MWATKKLHEVCDIQSGLWKGKKEPFTNALVLRNTNFTSSGRLDYSNVVELEVETKQLMKREVVKDDIILEKSGGGDKTPVGRVCIHNATSDVPFSLSNFTARLRVKNRDLLDAHFLHRFLYFLYISGKTEPMQRHSTGIRNLQLSQYKNIDIPLPPLTEQKRIVERLDKAFAEIDDLVSLGDAEEANGISVMAAWLAEIFSQDIKGSRNVLSLSAGGAEAPAKKGWKWKRLTEVAKLESGHTPSRKKPEYWGGEVKWVGIRDARESHGSLIHDTLQYTNELGIQNSSARILPPNTVCLSRTASVGYVFRLGVPMATSQDFINWVCGDALDPAFLQLLFMAEGEDIRRFGSGATHKTIYFSTAKSFYICIPDVEDQKKIVAEYQSIVKHQKALVASINQKNGLLKHLKASILKQELTPSELA